MGFLFGLLIKVALPEDLLGGHDSPYLKLLDILVPYAVATGLLAIVISMSRVQYHKTQNKYALGGSKTSDDYLSFQ